MQFYRAESVERRKHGNYDHLYTLAAKDWLVGRTKCKGNKVHVKTNDKR